MLRSGGPCSASARTGRGGVNADIHPGDLPDLLGRYGIDLIAEKIESEGMVVDLLDYDVKFGQGFLFSPPRRWSVCFRPLWS